jgi:hypothetical protein
MSACCTYLITMASYTGRSHRRGRELSTAARWLSTFSAPTEISNALYGKGLHQPVISKCGSRAYTLYIRICAPLHRCSPGGPLPLIHFMLESGRFASHLPLFSSLNICNKCGAGSSNFAILTFSDFGSLTGGPRCGGSHLSVTES